MPFRKYMHVERFGNTEVQGIELGKCFIFPKIDGTNGSVWGGSELSAGSRKRELSLESDNAGFFAAVKEDDGIKSFLYVYPFLTLYGEWLVPHSLKTYRDDAWKKFYVFDVYDNLNDNYLSYDEYKPLLDEVGINYIPPIAIMENPTYDSLIKELENNVFLVKDGAGVGEGIVIKNYDYVNRHGNTVWAKIITTVFKEKHNREMGAPVKPQKQMVEQEICDTYVNEHLISKVVAKITNENDGWSSKYIPRLLQTVFYDLINEELWNAIKKLKNPTINFRTLNSLVIMKIKEINPELF